MNLPYVRLGDVAQLINGDRGKNYPSENDFTETGVPFINAGHLDGGRIDFSAMNYISGDHFRRLGNGKTQRDDLLYCLRGSLGKLAIVQHDGPSAIASSLVIIRPACDHRFLYQFLSSPLGTGQIRKFDNGSSQPNLSAASLKEFQIPLPPLEEQRRIAGILDRADELRAKRRAALAQLDELNQAIFLDMFGDPVTNSKKWQRVEFRELLANIDSGWSPVCLDRPIMGDEWGILKLGAVTWCEYNSAENKALPPDVAPDPAIEVKPGDLLFARKNTYELVAACALVRDTPPRLLMSDL